MSQPILYVFAISHYCEKARWALDHCGIPFRLHHSIPGMNRRIANKLGSKSGSLPFLQIGDELVTGSSAIIDWGNKNRAPGKACLNGDNSEPLKALEKRLDDLTGVHIRRFYYSDALINDPSSVRPIFSKDLPFIPKISLIFAWPKITQVMIKFMDLGPQKGMQSRDILLGELDMLDALLSDGRPYLIGDTFTRADITAASLLAPLVNPAKHPTYSALSLPSALSETIKHWQDRPILKWVSKIYAEHR